MSAEVIIMPVIRKHGGGGGGEETATLQLRVPPKVYGRLKKIADSWTMTPNEAAESLLIAAVNEAIGVRK